MTHPPSDTDWLARGAAAQPGAIALVKDDGAEVTYEELDERASRAATRLHRMFAIGPATMMGFAPLRPSVELVAALWGSWRLGAAAMVVDPHSPILTGGAAAIQRRWGVPAFIDHLDLTEEPSLLQVAPGPTQLHTVVLTSGGSGNPRPVRLTHGNVAAAVAAASDRLGNTADDRWLLTLPLFHVGGLSILWRSAAAGGTVVVHDGFDAGRAAAAMKDGSVTIASLVPTMLYRILVADPGPYRRMKAVLLGGGAADRTLVANGFDAGLPILRTYGMTEACSQVATVAPGETRDALSGAARPLDGMMVTIDGDEDGVGEIVVDGPAVSPGYLGEPPRWGGHRTGDVGYIDEVGRLVVLGRADDMIVTGGENVYPGLVADVLARNRLIQQVEIVGVPDPEWGQSVVAIVVGNGAIRQRVERWARERLARHQVPKRWIFIDEMPLQANGKVNRVALLELAMREQ